MDIIRRNSQFVNSKFEEECLHKIKLHIEDYLNSNIASPEVRQYIEKVKVDDDLLLNYLRGRKHNPDFAWDTIRRYSENRFQHYPEVFHDTLPTKLRLLIETHCIGILKNTDKLGRRIIFFDMSKWDANLITLEELTIAAVVAAEIFWRRPEMVKNGIIFVENTEGFSLAHARQHTMSNVIRMRNIFLYCFPISIKGLYYLKMPYVFAKVSKMCKPLFPKKMRARMFPYSANEKPTELYTVASPEILPTFLGGVLSPEEAAEDISFYD